MSMQSLRIRTRLLTICVARSQAARQQSSFRTGIDIDLAAPAELRASLSIARDSIIVAGVGGLERRKGFDVLLRALAAMTDKYVHVVIAGEGGGRTDLEALADSLAIAERVHLIGQRKDVGAVLAAADCFVWPAAPIRFLFHSSRRWRLASRWWRLR